MGHSNESARQFIRSESGYTAVWRIGGGRYGYWDLWQGQLGVSEQDLMIAANKTLSDPWMKDGKTMTGDEIIEWVISGINSAMTVEEILEANPRVMAIACDLYPNRKIEPYEILISSTKELDDWITTAKDHVTNDGWIAVVDFGVEIESIRPIPKKIDNETGYLVKRGRDEYLAEFELNPLSFSFSENREKALVFPYREANEVMVKVNGTRVVSASAKTGNRQEAIIRLRSSTETYFLVKNSSSRLKYSQAIENAKRYISMSSARATLSSEAMQRSLKKAGFEAEVIPAP